MSTRDNRPLLEWVGWVWPKVKMPQSGLPAIAAQPVGSCRASPMVFEFSVSYVIGLEVGGDVEEDLLDVCGISLVGVDFG